MTAEKESKIRIATRGSKLALWQANHVKAGLEKANEGLEVELLVLKTKGDDKWYVWHFERIGFANKDDILDAKAFAEALAAGEVKVDMEKSMDDAVAKPKPSENDAALDEEVPF